MEKPTEDFLKFEDLFDSSRFGLLSDLDGTLLPIGQDPGYSKFPAENRDLLIQLRDLTPLVAIISGRGAGNLAARVGIPGLVYVGNHGLERWVGGKGVVPDDAAEFIQRVDKAAFELTHDLWPGMQVEDKGITLSLHYRQVEDPDAARAFFLPRAEEVAADTGLVVFEGRRIIELRPPLPLNKGSAFQALVREYELTSAVFLGDDTTDVSAFQMARELREEGVCTSYSLGVVNKESPPDVAAHADGTVSSVGKVTSFLGWCVEKLSRSAT